MTIICLLFSTPLQLYIVLQPESNSPLKKIEIPQGCDQFSSSPFILSSFSFKKNARNVFHWIAHLTICNRVKERILLTMIVSSMMI